MVSNIKDLTFPTCVMKAFRMESSRIDIVQRVDGDEAEARVYASCVVWFEHLMNRKEYF